VRRVLANPFGIAFAAVLLVAAVWVLVRGQQNHTLQADEYAFGLAGAYAFSEDFLGTLFAASPVYRGPERLMALLLYVPHSLFGDTADMFRAAHVLAGLLCLLAALPAYALARMLALERWQAALVAALAVATPWLLFGTTLLNVTIAYPLTTALVWAVVRAVTRPSPWNDLLVLAVAALGATARTGNLPFVAIAALAVLVQVWRDRPAGEPARRYPLRVVRTHPVLVAAGLLTLAVVAALGASAIIGDQYAEALPDDFSPGTIVSRAGMWGSYLILGSGFVVAMLALPWAVRQAVRPTDRVAGAFAVAALALFAVFVVSTLKAPEEERYSAVLAGLAPVAFGAAVFRRETSPLAAVLGGLVALRVVTANVPLPDAGSHAWMVGPARRFWYTSVEGRITEWGAPQGWNVVALVAVVAIAVAVALTLVRGRRLSVAGGVAGLALAALGIAQADWNAGRWLRDEGRRDLSWEDRTFIDRAVGEEVVLGWDYNPARAPNVPFGLNQAQAYNRDLDGALRNESMEQTWSCCGLDVRISADPRTGTLESTAPLPRYVLVPPGYQNVGFAGRFAGASRALPDFRLYDVGAQPRLSYLVTGPDTDGWLAPGRPALLRGYTSTDGGEPGCARLGLAAPPRAPARFRVGRQTVRLAPAETREVRVPIRRGAQLRISAAGRVRLPGGRVRAAALVGVVLDCDA
jgi:hypothetical protein